MFRRPLVATTLITLCSSFLFAADVQPRTISGIVVDVMGGSISGATVTLQTSNGERRTTSGADGAFASRSRTRHGPYAW
jgi:hypothetical protein